MTDWQPIETAPKDGTKVIGAYFGRDRFGEVVRVWWQPEFEAWISGFRAMMLAENYQFDDGSHLQLHSPTVETVTHWMPLTDPPEDEA